MLTSFIIGLMIGAAATVAMQSVMGRIIGRSYRQSLETRIAKVRWY